jgi:hypothetical protein
MFCDDARGSLWNVRRARMSPWPNESQKAIESVLAVFTLGFRARARGRTGKRNSFRNSLWLASDGTRLESRFLWGIEDPQSIINSTGQFWHKILKTDFTNPRTNNVLTDRSNCAKALSNK